MYRHGNHVQKKPLADERAQLQCYRLFDTSSCVRLQQTRSAVDTHAQTHTEREGQTETERYEYEEKEKGSG